MSPNFTVALVGNPNCGKTTLFNALTGSHQQVGNWPGVTVEKKSGEYRRDGIKYEVVDLPGTYSLDVVDREVSLDEKIARDFVHGNEADLVINIVDASNLERNLYLSSQLVEMRVPMAVAVNMIDVAAGKGIKVDAEALARALGCPAVAVIASTGWGVNDLRKVIDECVKNPQPAKSSVEYNESIEAAIAQLVPQLDAAAARTHTSQRWLAVRLLEGDDLAQASADTALSEQARTLGGLLGEDLDIMVADARYTKAHSMALACITIEGRATRDLTEKIDRVVLNRFLGIPVFLLMMYLMFMFTINIGSAFIDFFAQFTGALLVDGLAGWMGSAGSPQWLTVLAANGIGAGIQTVATFIPPVGFLFLFLSMLEDSGYMARAAFVMDRFMRWVGLPGKSFVPLIVGFGCNVPAIMATRTLEHRRDRLLTIAMAPFMSCGARLPVYVLFAAAFFPSSGQNAIFALYLTGITVAVLTGLVLKNSLLKGEATPFIMELPPYHLPTIRGILLHTWKRLKSFIVRAGRIIVPMVLVLNVLNAIGTDGSYGNENTENSVLATVGRTISPVFAPMGLSAENWPAAVGIFTGILAKEAVVGTLDATYSALAANDADESKEEEAPFNLSQSLKAAFATIPANLMDALGKWTDPVGLGVGDLSDEAAIAQEREVHTGTFGAMVNRFDGTAGAFAYLLFILLYAPCTAAIAAVYQEAGARWALFVAAWTTATGYGFATIFYQSAIWSRHPGTSSMWIGIMLALFAAGFALLRQMGKKESTVALPPGAQRA